MRGKVELGGKIFGLEVGMLKIFVPPLLLVLGFLVSISLVIRPRLEEVAKLRREGKELRTKIDLVSKKRNYLLTVDEVELSKNSAWVDAAILEKKDAYSLVAVIREIAADNGFYIKSFSVVPGEMETKTGEEQEGAQKSKNREDKKISTGYIPLNFVVAGPENKYLDFVISLERSLPVLALNSFDMEGSGDVVKLEIQVMAFYIKEKTDYKITDLTLEDLMLTEKEEELLARLVNFENHTKSLRQAGAKQEKFVDYNRLDPFSL